MRIDQNCQKALISVLTQANAFNVEDVKGACLRREVNKILNHIAQCKARHHQMPTNIHYFNITLTTIPTLNWGGEEKRKNIQNKRTTSFDDSDI